MVKCDVVLFSHYSPNSLFYFIHFGVFKVPSFSLLQVVFCQNESPQTHH